MDPSEGETILYESAVMADDTGRQAFAKVTNRRLVVEYPSEGEAARAVGEAAIAGHSPLPLPVDVEWRHLTEFVLVTRLTGMNAVKIGDGQGRFSLWKVKDAPALIEAVRNAQAQAPR